MQAHRQTLVMATLAILISALSALASFKTKFKNHQYFQNYLFFF
jgi:hypothetical protein